jgi:hypothetical protein
MIHTPALPIIKAMFDDCVNFRRLAWREHE